MSSPISRAPMAMALTSPCSRASRAETGSDTSAQRNPARRLAVRDGIGEFVAEVGIIDTFVTDRSEIGNVMPSLAQPGGKLGLHGNGGVIGGNGDAHGTLWEIRVGDPLGGETPQSHPSAANSTIRQLHIRS